MPTPQELWDAPITQADADGKLVTASAGKWLAAGNVKAGQARDDAAACLAILQNPTALAAAIVAQLPPSQGGTAPTAEEIAAAVASKFSTLLGGTS